MASITKLTEYAEAMNATPKPTDRFAITMDRATRDWIIADLAKRCGRLVQSVEDPRTNEKKRRRKHKEVLMMQEAVSALVDKAERI